MTNDEYLKQLAERGDGSLQAWFDAEHVEHDDVDANDSREKLEADILRDYLEFPGDRERITAYINRQAAITERRYRELTGTFQLESDKRIAELQSERDELREKLGIALDHAHDTLSLVDLEGNVL